MKRLPFIAIFFAAVLLVAADKKPEKAKEPPSPAQIQKWVKQLGDDSFKVREEATRELIKAGRVATNEVIKATKSEDGEVKQRALMILKQLKNAAIAYFKKRGGRIKVDKKSPGSPLIELSLRYTDITDSGLVYLKVLSKLKKLDFLVTRITDAGLVHLKGLTKLQVLYLSGTKVTDAGLVDLKGLAKLQDLDLWGTKITDAGLEHLKGFSKLQSLDLRGTKVTQAGIDKLQEALPKCKIRWESRYYHPNPPTRPVR